MEPLTLPQVVRLVVRARRKDDEASWRIRDHLKPSIRRILAKHKDAGNIMIEAVIEDAFETVVQTWTAPDSIRNYFLTIAENLIRDTQKMAARHSPLDAFEVSVETTLSEEAELSKKLEDESAHVKSAAALLLSDYSPLAVMRILGLSVDEMNVVLSRLRSIFHLKSA